MIKWLQDVIYHLQRMHASNPQDTRNLPLPLSAASQKGKMTRMSRCSSRSGIEGSLKLLHQDSLLDIRGSWETYNAELGF